ncbi:hypothetical protein [Roseobacter sp. S98]|uniref:hypothetical protein n=1 Tax=Roseobacter algicola (ex Choi et al. 2025) (nom. illeg.) TaxID=3092138 RepID=UPI0035C6B61B
MHGDIPKTLTEFPVDRLRMPLADKRENISLFLATVTKAGGGHMLRWDTRDDWWFPDRTPAVSNEKSPVRQVPLSASAATLLAGLFLFAPCWMLERPDARRRRAVRTRFTQIPAERADGA